MKEAHSNIISSQKPRTYLQKIFLYIEDYLNRIFTPQFNPFYYLGAISTVLYAVVIISGLYLFIFYRTSEPYQIVQDITEQKWYLGGLMRSLHRYSSDALIIFLLLHVLREYVNDRYSGSRWLAWVTGVVLLILTILIGITGYWLVWDERAQMLALKTSELFNDISLFIEPISISFLKNESLHVLLFFVLHLVHLALPVALIILIGIHVFRCSRPVITTPKMMTIAMLIILTAMSVIIPAKSAPPADLNRLPVDVPFDWFYFFIYPIRDVIPKWPFWIIVTGATALFFFLPWTKRSRLIPAKIILDNCTGCDQCNKDCPYEAIRMRGRTDNMPYRMEATVISERCVSCGICVGACDFHAINLPALTEAGIKDDIVEILSSDKQRHENPEILLFVCSRSIELKAIADSKGRSVKGMENVKLIVLPCIGMVQSSIIEHGFKSGADGVFLCGCQINDCQYREGNAWLQARIEGKRAPLLSKTIDHSRIYEYWTSAIHADKMMDEIRHFEDYLKVYHKSAEREVRGRKSAINERKALIRLAALSIVPAFFVLFLSFKPIYPFYAKGDSLIKLALKYTSRHKVDCRELTEKETESKPRHMRKTNSLFSEMRMECVGERMPIDMEISLDDKKMLSKTYYPSGLKNDGPTFMYEELSVKPGAHRLKVTVKDAKVPAPLNYTLEKDIEIKEGEISVVDLTGNF